jgi:hypothetical protein
VLVSVVIGATGAGLGALEVAPRVLEAVVLVAPEPAGGLVAVDPVDDAGRVRLVEPLGKVTRRPDPVPVGARVR